METSMKLNSWDEKYNYQIKNKAQHYLDGKKKMNANVVASACDSDCGAACGSSCDCAGSCD